MIYIFQRSNSLDVTPFTENLPCILIVRGFSRLFQIPSVLDKLQRVQNLSTRESKNSQNSPLAQPRNRSPSESSSRKSRPKPINRGEVILIYAVEPRAVSFIPGANALPRQPL